MGTETHVSQVVPVELAGDSWPGSLTRLVAEVAGLLGDPETGHLVLVEAEPPAEPERAGAVREALRSLVHASVLERPGRRVNLVLGGTGADREATLAYLSSAAFVVGATVDLGRPS